MTCLTRSVRVTVRQGRRDAHERLFARGPILGCDPVSEAAPGVTGGVALALRSVSKTFGVQLALDSVDLTVRVGEIHALVGQNGSGKSTVVKLLGGYHAPDQGCEAFVGEQPFQLGSMTAAGEAGLRFVHQDLGLVEHLSVSENFFMSPH